MHHHSSKSGQIIAMPQTGLDLNALSRRFTVAVLQTDVQCKTRLNGFKATLSLIFSTASLISLTAISLLRAPSVLK